MTMTMTMAMTMTMSPRAILWILSLSLCTCCCFLSIVEAAFVFKTTPSTKTTTLTTTTTTTTTATTNVFTSKVFSSPTTTTARTRTRLLLEKGNNNNNDDFVSNNNDNDDDDDDSLFLLTSLRQRQLLLEQQDQEIKQRWRDAKCQQAAIPLPDWVRRVSVQWPLASCGSSQGDVYLIQCETGAILGKGESNQDQRRYDDVPIKSTTVATVLNQLYGDFDGGGTLSISLSSSWNNIIAHAGRNGGVELWVFDTASSSTSSSSSLDETTGISTPKLKSKGILLKDELITSVVWGQHDDLWVGTQDGRVLVYSFDNDIDDDDFLPTSPTEEWNNLGGGTILSLSFNEELDVAIATTSTGIVEILSMEDDDPNHNTRRSFYPPFDSGRMRSNAFALCATIVQQQEQEQMDNGSSSTKQFSLACGGNDGSLFLQPLRLLPIQDTIDPELDLDRPFGDEPIQTLTPKHVGPCKCLTSPFPGILISGGQDGTVRVWDLNAKKNKKKNNNNEEQKDKQDGLYLLSGFKVWLGSLWSDGTRLVMDGSDNAIRICDFGGGGGPSK